MSIVTRLNPLGGQSKKAYSPNEIIFEESNFTINNINRDLEIKEKGVFEIEIASPGSGGCYMDGGTQDFFQDVRLWSYHIFQAGATGAYYKGELNLSKGTYKIQLGCAGSCFIVFHGTFGPNDKNGGDSVKISKGSETYIEISGGSRLGDLNSRTFSAGGEGGKLKSIANEKTRIKYVEGYSRYPIPPQIFHDIPYPNPSPLTNPNNPVPSTVTNYNLLSIGGASYGTFETQNHKGGGSYLKITYKGVH